MIIKWCFSHPWMTFFIVLAMIEGITDIVHYISSAIDNKSEENIEREVQRRLLINKERKDE